jgi:hypothetical protein
MQSQGKRRFLRQRPSITELGLDTKNLGRKEGIVFHSGDLDLSVDRFSVPRRDAEDDATLAIDTQFQIVSISSGETMKISTALGTRVLESRHLGLNGVAPEPHSFGDFLDTQ